MKLGMGRIAALSAILVGGCQALVGIDDKQLDPSYGQKDAAANDAPTEAGLPAGFSPTPPARPPGDPSPSGNGSTRWFVARTIFLGSVDPFTKQGSSTAWEKIGHDIDGECTTTDISTSDSSSSCKRAAAAKDDSLVDGDDCRDNAGGRLFETGADYLAKDFEKSLHAKLFTAESATFLLRLDDLDSGSDDPYVRGSLYVTVPRDPNTTPPPSWDGGDEFVIDTRSLASNPDAGIPPTNIEAPRFVFDKGYLKDDIWVSGDFKQDPRELPLFVFNDIQIIHSSTVTLVVELTPTHDNAVSSILSAVVSGSALQTEFKPIADEITNCIPLVSGLFMSQFLLPARDLGDAPPTFKTPGQACGSLSMGFAFEWIPAKASQFFATPTPKPSACGSDAGDEAGSDAGDDAG